MNVGKLGDCHGRSLDKLLNYLEEVVSEALGCVKAGEPVVSIEVAPCTGLHRADASYASVRGRVEANFDAFRRKQDAYLRQEMEELGVSPVLTCKLIVPFPDGDDHLRVFLTISREMRNIRGWKGWPA